MDNPVALLRYAVGDRRTIERGMLQHCRRWRTVLHNQIQGWSKSGGVLRSPHNAPNNIIHLWNTYSKPLQKYFPNIGDNVICV